MNESNVRLESVDLPLFMWEAGLKRELKEERGMRQVICEDCGGIGFKLVEGAETRDDTNIIEDCDRCGGTGLAYLCSFCRSIIYGKDARERGCNCNEYRRNIIDVEWGNKFGEEHGFLDVEESGLLNIGDDDLGLGQSEVGNNIKDPFNSHDHEISCKTVEEFQEAFPGHLIYDKGTKSTFINLSDLARHYRDNNLGELPEYVSGAGKGQLGLDINGFIENELSKMYDGAVDDDRYHGVIECAIDELVEALVKFNNDLYDIPTRSMREPWNKLKVVRRRNK